MTALVALTPVVAVLGLAAAVGVATFVRHCKVHRWYRVTWWALTGHHLDGRHRVNRTWLWHGNRPVAGPMDAHLHWWTRRSRLLRASVVWGFLVTAAYLVWGLHKDWALTVTVAYWVSLAIGVGVTEALTRRAVRTRHRRKVIRPLAVPLAGHMGASANVVAGTLRAMPKPELAQAGDPVFTIKALPNAYAANPTERQFVEQLLATRSPVPLTFRWETHRHPMRLQALCASAPPREVRLGDWLGRIDGLPPGRYFLAVSANDQPEVWDATEEDPDLAVNARSRRGKTNLLMGIAAQALRRGERVTAIDPKRVSLAMLAGVPGFTLANDPNDPQAMWEAIHDFKLEMDQAIAENRYGWDGTHPHLLMLEEVNRLFSLFRRTWEKQKGPDQRITEVPPWEDVKDILHQGAQFGYYVVVDGQDLKDQVLFGARDAFGQIIGAFTPKQWGYVVGTTPVPPMPDQRGRFHLVRGGGGGHHGLVQVVIADPRGGSANEVAWRLFALNGRQPQASPQAAATRAWAERLMRAPRAIGWHRGPERRAISPVLIGPKAGAAYLNMTQQSFKALRRRHPIKGEFTHARRGQEWACWTRESLDAWVAEVEESRRERV